MVIIKGQISGSTLLIIYVVVLAALFYVMILMPQKKRAKERQQLLQSLKVNDEVITVAGIYGTVKSIQDDVVMLKVDANTTIKVAKDAVGAIVSKKEEAKKDELKKEDKKKEK